MQTRNEIGKKEKKAQFDIAEKTIMSAVKQMTAENARQQREEHEVNVSKRMKL
jgi:hypothetical protein